MDLGLQLPSFSFPGGPSALRRHLTDIGQAADAAGIASVWVMDHLFQLPEDTGWGGPDEPMLEAYSTLGFLAAATDRVRLGALVGCALFREPGLLVKAATTVDVLSGGRLTFGIGAGWYQREAIGLGIGFPDRRERFERLEETVRIARQAWAGDRTPIEGHHYRLPEPIVVPGPIGRPRPPIMIGGNGERRTLRLVAQLGDACNLLVPTPEETRHKLAVLQRHCHEVKRNYTEIERTALVEADLRSGRAGVAELLATARAQAAAGIQHLIVNMPDAHDLRHLETIGREVVPALSELAAA